MIKFGSGTFEGPYTFKSRTTDQSPQTNPEELIGSAHAACFSMALSALLSKDKHPPRHIHTIAKVHLDSNADGFFISAIDLETEGNVPDLTNEEFQKYAENAKSNCPISKALKAVPIHFKATLRNE
jgi:osmotically inducible protein OsmC